MFKSPYQYNSLTSFYEMYFSVILPLVRNIVLVVVFSIRINIIVGNVFNSDININNFIFFVEILDNFVCFVVDLKTLFSKF
jgi:hypothetical protein